jgi:two-component system chemotaxis response regulator CheB
MASPARRIIVIGASSGGLEALQTIAAGLPPDIPAAVCVVLHTAPESPGMLPAILGRRSRLPAVMAETGMRLDEGHIYVAPPDYHVLIEPGVLCVTRGPRENRFRPAIDPLFRSAAQVYGPAAIGVILTGSLDDGTAGLWNIKRLGGVTVVQDPTDALFPSMPASAAAHVEIDYSVGLPQIAPLLGRLAAAPAEEAARVAVPEQVEIEVKIAKEENAIDAGLESISDTSPFSCPECHGVLRQLKDGRPLRYRCHTGHAFSVESLVAAISSGIEDALWNAVRALEEGGLLLEQLATHLREPGHDRPDAEDASASVGARAAELRRQADAVRQIVTLRRELTARDA